jgi:hypothetical protein
MCELQKRGVVSAVICSDPFFKLAKAQACVFGVPDLPLVVIPHPLGGIELASVMARADAALPQVLELIEGHAQ